MTEIDTKKARIREYHLGRICRAPNQPSKNYNISITCVRMKKIWQLFMDVAKVDRCKDMTFHIIGTQLKAIFGIVKD